MVLMHLPLHPDVWTIFKTFCQNKYRLDLNLKIVNTTFLDGDVLWSINFAAYSFCESMSSTTETNLSILIHGVILAQETTSCNKNCGTCAKL